MDLERYRRQVVIPEIGEEGQHKLAASSVLVVGAGGLGGPLLFLLQPLFQILLGFSGSRIMQPEPAVPL